MTIQTTCLNWLNNMETKKKKYYKPGQLVTIDGHIYRLQKGECKDCPAYRARVISDYVCVRCWWTFRVGKTETAITSLNLKPVK